MMLPTHILMGASFGLLAPTIVASGALAAALGSILPDLDILLEHHRTLHRPEEYMIGVILLLSGYYLTGQQILLTSAFFFGGSALHCYADIFSQGKTKNPEIRKDGRAVYDHIRHHWIHPQRIVIEGSRRDFFLTLIFSLILFWNFSGLASFLIGLVLVLGGAQYLLEDWFTKDYISDYDRFSEFIQQKIGFGPETSSGGK